MRITVLGIAVAVAISILLAGGGRLAQTSAIRAVPVVDPGETPQGDDLESIRHDLVGKELWTIGTLQPSTSSGSTGILSVEAGTRLRLESVERAEPSDIVLSGTYAPEIAQIHARTPVTLVFAERRFPEWDTTASLRVDVIDRMHLDHLFSPTPPPASVLIGGRVRTVPVFGMTSDEAAWIWGWPPVRRTPAAMRLMREWTWGHGFHERSLGFDGGVVAGVEPFPSLP